MPAAERIATFDQDGTLWVEHPMYTQVIVLPRPRAASGEGKPELAKVEPFKTVLSGDREAIAKLSMHDLEKILAATLTGMTVDDFTRRRRRGSPSAKDPRWKRPYTELTYQPMQEVLSTCAPTATRPTSSPAAARISCASTPSRSTAFRRSRSSAPRRHEYGYDKDGKPFLTKEPKLLLNDNNAGKPEGIHLMIGRRPYAAFGNSTGDRQMLEYTEAGDGARLAMLVLHDDATREYAYGPAQGLPDTKVGTFTQALYDEAKKQGWIVISMKNDWKRIFAFEQCAVGRSIHGAPSRSNA